MACVFRSINKEQTKLGNHVDLSECCSRALGVSVDAVNDVVFFCSGS